MTSRTTQRQSEKRRPHDIRHLSEHFVTAEGHLRITRIASDGPEPVKARGNSCRATAGLVIDGEFHFITGQLLSDELVIRFVRIEGVDHIVSKPPCIRVMAVVLEALRFRKPHNIQPMLPPAFTVSRTGQQFMNQIPVSSR